MPDLDVARQKGHLSASMTHNAVLRALDNEDLTPVLKDLMV